MEDKLQELIEQGESLAGSIVMGQWGYSLNKKGEYQTWVATSKRYLKSYYPEDLVDFDYIIEKKNQSPTKHASLVGILKAVQALPQKIEPTQNYKGGGTTIQIDNKISQSQNQSQQLIFEVFIESISDTLTGKQLKELKAILEESKDEPEVCKTKLMDKFLSFGENVASNILANIITNPAVLGGILG